MWLAFHCPSWTNPCSQKNVIFECPCYQMNHIQAGSGRREGGHCTTLNLVCFVYTKLFLFEGASFTPGQFTIDKGITAQILIVLCSISTFFFFSLKLCKATKGAAGATLHCIVHQITLMIDGPCDSQLSQCLEGELMLGGGENCMPRWCLGWVRQNKIKQMGRRLKTPGAYLGRINIRWIYLVSAS